jgi:acetyl esterase/lipase
VENITELIKKAVKDTSERIQDENIVSPKDMIPLMSPSDYTKKYNLDISYGEKEEEKFDIFYPEEELDEYPVLIEIHGGAWFFGQKRSVEFKPFLEGVNRGFAVISLGYSLCPTVSYPEPIIQIKRAIAYIKKNHKALKINVEKIALWGGSAGAQLAALAVFSEKTGYLKLTDSEYKDMDLSISALCLWYGCFDFYEHRKLEDWIYYNFFNTDDFSKVSKELELSNPSSHIKNNLPKTFIQHGKRDGLVPYEQSVILYNNIIKYPENFAELSLLEDCDHADFKMFEKLNIIKLYEKIEEYMEIK